MRKVIIGALTAIAAVACTSVSTTTTLKGKFSGADVPEEVTVTIPGVIDTTVRLQNAAFKIVLPVYKAAFGQVTAGNAAGRFIADGTTLTANLNDGLLSVNSEKPSVSLTEKFNAFVEDHQAVKALKENDIETFGKLMNASHVSLRDDYETSCPEVDVLVDEAWKIPGVIGSRITGGGFGGCTVSIVKDEAIDQFKANLTKAYEEKVGKTPEFYVVSIGDGPSRLA